MAEIFEWSQSKHSFQSIGACSNRSDDDIRRESRRLSATLRSFVIDAGPKFDSSKTSAERSVLLGRYARYRRKQGQSALQIGRFRINMTRLHLRERERARELHASGDPERYSPFTSRSTRINTLTVRHNRQQVVSVCVPHLNMRVVNHRVA